jgi:hypothetical protein
MNAEAIERNPCVGFHIRQMDTPRILALVAGLASTLAAAAAPDLAAALEDLRAVAAGGRSNGRAAVAWKTVAATPAADLPRVLAAMDGANDYALNWLRTAAETALQRGVAAGDPPPLAELRAFLRDTAHHPRARHLAFEWIRRAAPATAAELVDGFLEDPANGLRREAVAHRIALASAKAGADKPGAVAGLRSALSHAREADQIEDIAKRLDALGDKVDLAAVFGWITRWKLIGPIDNAGGAGFDRPYPPETGFDPAAEIDGKSGKVRWLDHETRDPYGLVDFNGPFKPLKGVAGYAAAEFLAPKARRAEIRLGTKNGWKIWLNGRPVFGRDEYHRNMEIDQYRLPVELVAGRNVILVKCCQNEQTEEWTKEWEFQLRVTDEQGTPIASAR